MLKKLNLDGTKDYEIAIATSHLAEMLVSFIEGRKHTLNLGAEQGDIQKWDDIVLDEGGFFRQFQIKRQNTDFSNEPCIRNVYTKDVRKGTLKDLSEFDKTIEALAEWTKTHDPSADSPKRNFEVYVPIATILIKNEIDINFLKKLCEEHIRAVTVSSGLIALQAQDQKVNHCYNWLTSWCGFDDWDHILKALKVLKINIVGSRDDLDINSKNTLSRVFNSPEDVMTKVKGYLSENTTFTGAISPRPLLFLLKGNLLPGINQWSQFEQKDSKWEVSGIHDSILQQEIERASIIVPELWNKKTLSSLKIVIPDNLDSPLLNKILHLALHIEGLSNTHILNHLTWKQVINTKIGETLGNDKNDCNNLSIVENTSSFSSSDCKTYETLRKQDELAKEIDSEIIKTTWKGLCASLNKKLTETVASELRNAMDARWRIWVTDLNNDIEQQKQLFKAMLHPAAEGEEIEGELRIGVKTIDLIADGLFLLLAVSVALSPDHNSWNKISDYSSTTIGLSYWSGPTGRKRKVQEIDEGIKDIIGKTNTDILVLSKVKLNESEMLDSNIASSTITDNSLAQSHRPKLIITNEIKIRNIINEGQISTLKDYLEEIIKRNEISTTKSIKDLTP